MRSLLLIGGGGHCCSCIDVIESTKNFQIRGVVQPKFSADSVLGYSIIGSDDDLPRLIKRSKLALITVGQIKNPTVRIQLFDFLTQLGAELAVVISPKAHFSRRSFIGEGSIVMHGAIVNANVRIGKNCIVNSQALLEHDVVIHDHCHISTGALVNGNVTVGKGSFVGSGAVLKQGVKLGENVIIGAGQVVLGDVPDDVVVKTCQSNNEH